MSEADLTLAAEFEPATRAAWLALVDKVLKGGDFEKRLVSHTADGVPIQPLYTRADRAEGRGPVKGRAGRPAGTGTYASAIWSPIPRPPMPPFWRIWRVALPPSCCR